MVEDRSVEEAEIHPFDEMKSWVGFTEADTERLGALVSQVRPHLSGIAGRFYETIQRFPRARRVFADQAQVDRLQASLQSWIVQVLQGPHDHSFYDQHLRVGHRHVEVGLPQQYMFTAMNQLRSELMELVGAGEEAAATRQSLMRILDLELAVMMESYVQDKQTRELVDLRNLLMQHLPIVALLLDADGNVAASTGSARSLLRQAAHPGPVHYDELLDPAVMEAADLPALLEQALVGGAPVSIPRLDIPGDGDTHTLRLTVVPLEHPQARLLLHLEDLTLAISHEARARHAENLAQLGQMAAAIAHELRNPLAGFSATMQVLMGSLPETDRRRAIMNKVLDQIKRLDGLVTDLLQFARPVKTECAPTDLKAVARRVASQISLADIGRTTVTGAGAGYADAALLQQAVFNLVLNAWQAEATQVELRVGPGTIEVLDDGPGIPPGKQDEIFTPFVTTRTRGTGLGLPNALRFVEAMEGSLRLCASPHGGAGFRIQLLPAQAPSADRASPSDSGGRSG